MENIYSYIEKYKNKSFYKVKFNEVDNLILSLVSYVDFSSMYDSVPSKTIEELGKTYLSKVKLKDIKKYGYGVDLYSRDWLVTGFGDGVVDNITEENVVSLKSGKIVNQMIDCCRYRGLPYLFKNVYTYTNDKTYANSVNKNIYRRFYYV